MILFVARSNLSDILHRFASWVDPRPVGKDSARRRLRNSRVELSALDIAKKRVGGAVGLAKALGGITSQAVSPQWARVPATRVLEVERLTGISRYDLRPDIYGSAAPVPSEAVA